MSEPIIECRPCKGEGICPGDPLPTVCGACVGEGIVAKFAAPIPFPPPVARAEELQPHELAPWSAHFRAGPPPPGDVDAALAVAIGDELAAARGAS